MFFSEEKNQKTFIITRADGYRPWPAKAGAAEGEKNTGLERDATANADSTKSILL
jgi:hypothetical protein